MTDLSAVRSISLTRLLTMRSQPIVLRLVCSVVVGGGGGVVVVDVVFVVVVVPNVNVVV